LVAIFLNDVDVVGSEEDIVDANHVIVVNGFHSLDFVLDKIIIIFVCEGILVNDLDGYLFQSLDVL
jgi:hypothetical protein